MHGLTRSLAVLCIVVSFSVTSVAHAGSKSADKKELEDFKALVTDFSQAEKIEAWEAFLQKYPKNRYNGEVRKILAELRGDTKKTASKPKAKSRRKPNPNSVSADPDLDFLTDVDAPVVDKGGNAKPSTDDILADVGDVGEPSFPDDPFASEPKAAPKPAPRKSKKRVAKKAAPVASSSYDSTSDPFATDPGKADDARKKAEREAAKQRAREEKERQKQARLEAKRKERAEREAQKQREAAEKARREEQERQLRLAQEKREKQEAARRAEQERLQKEREEAAAALARMRKDSSSDASKDASDTWDPPEVKAPKERRIARADKPVVTRARRTPDNLGVTSSGATFTRDRGGFHVEINPHVGIGLDEVYVRNPMFGADIGVHVGRFVVLEGEALGAAANETDVLTQLRDRNATPEVISKYNFAFGGALAVNVLGGQSELFGSKLVRHDVFVRGGGGIVNTNLEICQSDESGNPCTEPLFIDGANFSYFTVGAGHRYYVTRWLALRTELRYRVVFELIDNVTTPRPNLELNAGASIVF